ncbi:MAG: archease [Armatimonadetes bacterium]|nr:archease [Armatimonadota bacterium]
MTGEGSDEGEVGFVPFAEAEHTADLALVARGRDLAELALNACRGAIALIGDTRGLTAEVWVRIEAQAPEPERLLVRLVTELLVAWELQGGLPVAVELEPAPEAPETLSGRVGFAHPDDLEERITGLPKAATYHDLRIRPEGDLLTVTLVLDV